MLQAGKSLSPNSDSRKKGPTCCHFRGTKETVQRVFERVNLLSVCRVMGDWRSYRFGGRFVMLLKKWEIAIPTEALLNVNVSFGEEPRVSIRRVICRRRDKQG